MKTYLYSIITIGLLIPVLGFSQSVDDKPFSLQKDRENTYKFWEENSIKSPSDSLIKEILFTLRNEGSEEILTCFQKYIYHIKNRKVFKVLDSIYLTEPDENVKIIISNYFHFHNYTEAIPNLIKSLEDSNIHITYNAACSLAALGEKVNSLKTFKLIWDSVNWQKKQGINRGLRNIGTPEAISILIKNTLDTNTYVACGAAICLAQIGYYDEAFPVLKEMLSIDTRKVSAMIGLSYIGDKKSLDLIAQMISDKNSHVRSQSIRILKAYGYFNKEDKK